MANAIENALRRKNEIGTAMAAFEAELAEIDTFLALHAKFSGTDVETENNEKEQSVSRISDATEPAPERKRGRPADFADIMRRLIGEVGRPMNRPELADLLEKRGVPIPSDDKPRYLGTILWRHRQIFHNLAGHGYWLKDRPYPPAGYDPAHDTDMKRLLESEAGFAEGRTKEELMREHDALVAELEEHHRRYHTEDAPTISDATYDKLRARKDLIESRLTDVF